MRVPLLAAEGRWYGLVTFAANPVVIDNQEGRGRRAAAI